MPHYDFKCTKCDNVFDDIIDTDEDFPMCPKCDGEVKKLISKNISFSVSLGAKEYRESIDKEVKELAQKMQHGDEDVCADVLGEERMLSYLNKE